MASSEPSLPKAMKAWTVPRNCKPTGPNSLQGVPSSALSLVAARPAPPAPTGSTILVKVLYASLNPADIAFMGGLPAWLPFRRAPIPGLDFAGEVVAAGPSSPIRPGALVGGALSVPLVAFGAGSLAEYVSVPAELVAVAPEARGWGAREAAGAFGIAGQTAALMLREAGAVGEGTRVLINGASGGVGSMLVQVAKGQGATVIAVCSGANEAFVKRLGADEVIDYKTHDPMESFLAERFQDDDALDCIFDCAGSDALFLSSPKYLKPNGKFLNIVAGGILPGMSVLRNMLLPRFLGGVPRSYKLVGLAPAGTYAREVAKWVDDGHLKEVAIDEEFAFEDAVKAYEKLATKRAKGKIVVKVQD